MIQLIFFIELIFSKRKTCSGIWNYDGKGENLNTSMQHQTCAKMRRILQKIVLLCYKLMFERYELAFFFFLEHNNRSIYAFSLVLLLFQYFAFCILIILNRYRTFKVKDFKILILFIVRLRPNMPICRAVINF